MSGNDGAYLDSSVVTAIAFVEPGAGDLRARLQQYAQLDSAPCRRRRCDQPPGAKECLSLRPEIIRVLDTGYVRAQTAGIWRRRCTSRRSRSS